MASHKLIPFPNGATRSLLVCVQNFLSGKNAVNPKPRNALNSGLRRSFATSSRVSSTPFLHEAAFVNNELVQAVGNATFPVVNPVNSHVIGLVPDMGEDDTEKVGTVFEFNLTETATNISRLYIATSRLVII